MAATAYLERTLKTVVEFQDAHPQRLTDMMESFEADLSKVITAAVTKQAKTAPTLVQTVTPLIQRAS